MSPVRKTPHPARRRVVGAAFATVVLLVALPAPASAQRYCVNVTPCLLGSAQPSLNHALSLAALAPGEDTISLGPSDAPYPGAPFAYSGADPVHIEGAGADAGGTTLGPSGDVSQPTLRIAGGTNSTVRNLAVQFFAGGAFTGLDLRGTASDLRVQQVAGGGGGNGAGTAVLLREQALLRDSRVFTTTGYGLGSEASAAQRGSVIDTTVTSTLSTAAVLTHPARLLRTTLSGLEGMRATGPIADVEIANSVIRSSLGVGVSVEDGGSLDGRHLSVVRTGTVPGVGVEVEAGAEPAQLALSNSLVQGYVTAIKREATNAVAPATLSVAHSAWTGVTIDSGPGVLTLGEGNLPNTAATFVRADPGDGGVLPADLHLRAPSALIDAAHPAVNPLDTDRDGQARSLIGVAGHPLPRADIGAYEYLPHQPTSVAIGGPTETELADPVLLAGSADDPDPGERELLTYAWAFSDGTTAVGAAVSHTFAAPGPQYATLTVTDPAGFKAAVTKAFLVTAPVVVEPATPPGPGPPGQGQPGSGEPQTPQGDRLAPTLSGFSLARRLVLRNLAVRRLAKPKGAPLRLVLSEPATVTLRFAQLRRGGKTRAVKRALVLKLPAGASGVRFTGRVARGTQLAYGIKYRVTATAVDAAGNRSKAVSATFTTTRKAGR